VLSTRNFFREPKQESSGESVVLLHPVNLLCESVQEAARREEEFQ